jgi:hypothetical protein
MVTMFDDEMVRIMAPQAAIMLAVLLIEKAGKHFPAATREAWER